MNAFVHAPFCRGSVLCLHYMCTPIHRLSSNTSQCPSPSWKLNPETPLCGPQIICLNRELAGISFEMSCAIRDVGWS